jgi:hypothetical protein
MKKVGLNIGGVAVAALLMMGIIMGTAKPAQACGHNHDPIFECSWECVFSEPCAVPTTPSPLAPVN